jgi:hypothetical protein
MTVKVSTLSTQTDSRNVRAGYRKWTTPATFVGFGLKRTESPRWADLRQAYFTADCTTLKGLEAWADSKNVTVYAVFEDPQDGSRWAGYLWRGCFRVGSSADRLELAAP